MAFSPLRPTQSPRQATANDNRSKQRNAPRKSAVRATPQVFASPSQILADPTDQAQTALANVAGRPSLGGAPDDHTRKKRRVTFSRRQELTDYDREEPTVNIRPASEMPMPDTPSTQSNLTQSSVESESMSMDMSMTGIYNQTPVSAHSSHRASSSFASPGSSMSISGYRLSSPHRPSMGRSSVGSARSSAYDDDEDSEEDDDDEDQSMSMDMSMTNVQNAVRPRSSISLYQSRQSLKPQDVSSARSRPSVSFNQSRQSLNPQELSSARPRPSVSFNQSRHSLGSEQAELSRRSPAAQDPVRSRRSSVAQPIETEAQNAGELSMRSRHSLSQQPDRSRHSLNSSDVSRARSSPPLQKVDADLSGASTHHPESMDISTGAEQQDESDDSEADVELQLQDTTVEVQKRARMEAIQACDQEVLADLHEAIDEQASVLNDYRQKRQRANDQLERIQARLNEVLGQKQVLVEAIASARDVYQSIQASTGGSSKMGNGGPLESARLLHGFEKKIPGLHRWTVNLKPNAQLNKRVGAGSMASPVEMVYDSVLILQATLDRNSAAAQAVEAAKGGRRSSSAMSAMSKMPLLRHAQVQLARGTPAGSTRVIQDFAVDVVNDTLQQLTATACSSALVMRTVSHIWQRQTQVQGEFAFLQARRPTEVIRIETTGVPVSMDDSASDRDVNNQALMLSSTVVLKRLRAKIRFHVGCSADMFAGIRVGEGAELEYLDGPAGWEAHTAVIEGVYGDVDSEAMMDQAIECLERSSGQVGPYARLVHACDTLSAIYDV
ncbi:hypothetical protein OC845_004458 [Tilletia horrida]|nr:hypothetical protein OC845_004458 [Tilletia horrida]